jgi:hypothetical protein
MTKNVLRNRASLVKSIKARAIGEPNERETEKGRAGSFARN